MPPHQRQSTSWQSQLGGGFRSAISGGVVRLRPEGVGGEGVLRLWAAGGWSDQVVLE